jgi:hypothetical protein
MQLSGIAASEDQRLRVEKTAKATKTKVDILRLG